MTTPTKLLRALLAATLAGDGASIGDLITPDAVAMIPDHSSTALDRNGLLAWIDRFGSQRGTMRLDLTDLIESTATSVASAVLFTAFTDRPGSSLADPPNWTTRKTIVAMNTDPTGQKIADFFFLVDQPEQSNHVDLADLVNDWYHAYATHDATGYALPFASDAIVWNFSSDTPISETRSPFSASVEGYDTWCTSHTQAGVVVNDLVVCGTYVATTVQWLAVAHATGQQKMTNEVHIFECTAEPKFSQARFYYTIRCSGPGQVCVWG